METGIYLINLTTEELKEIIKESVKSIFEVHEIKQKVVEGELYKSNIQLPENLLSREQISDYLGITLTTLHKWMNKGLPYSSLNGRRYFLISEIREYMKEKSNEAL